MCTMGKLRGIKLTADLRSVVQNVLLLPQPSSNDNTNGDNAIHDEPTKTSNNATSTTPEASSARARQARRALASSPFASPVSSEEARAKLQRVVDASSEMDKNDGEASSSSFLPLADLRALTFLIQISTCDESNKDELKHQLESSLRTTSLSFSPNNASKKFTSSPTDQRHDQTGTHDQSFTPFQKRMQHLRLLDEEKSYKRLTTNLKDIRSLKDDNITAKSMMYATSVGLNMIVAPVSFGVFMYFFSGSLFARFFDRDGDVDGSRGSHDGNGTDIRRVIAGVVSGVFMLFVEMILFVIRSHELDASVRKKARRRENRANPFGYTERTAKRVYDRDD
mmetsp:Transcript_25444/g.53246  ORF Transcript_25444/g.53246 Transcript_25444/m.53246 type:complete len:337 (+) Transcript_25444:17-1027(+)